MEIPSRRIDTRTNHRRKLASMIGRATLQNNLLKIDIKKIGAELCGISSVKNNLQFMWNSNPDVWANYAPNLFPIVGMLKNQTYYFKGKTYHLPKHGFIRDNSNFYIVEDTNERVSFRLSWNDESLQKYPFKFEYNVIYHLDGNKLHVTYKVVNANSVTMYFSVGGHPAFKCPVYQKEQYSDYHLVFNTEETSKTHLLNLDSGLLTNKTKEVFDAPYAIQLRYDLFNEDALIFKDLKSRKVTLHSKSNGDILTVHFEDFPYLGLWAKPNSDYVCIEPWLGIADSQTTNQQLTDKEGIVTLDAGKSFSAIYTIEIHQAHLV